MIKLLKYAAVVFGLAGIVCAETDYIALKIIKDIQAGTQNQNAIVDLYTTGDGTIGDDFTVTDDASIGGDLTVTGTISGPTTLSAADLTTTDDLTVGDDAMIIGDLVVSGAVTMVTSASAADLTATDDLIIGDDAMIIGDLVVSGAVTMVTSARAASFGLDGNAGFDILNTTQLVFITTTATNIIDADITTP